jgi:hypothetical protein
MYQMPVTKLPMYTTAKIHPSIISVSLKYKKKYSSSRDNPRELIYFLFKKKLGTQMHK